MKRLVRFCSYYSESLKKSLADAGIKYEWTQEKPDPYQPNYLIFHLDIDAPEYELILKAIDDAKLRSAPTRTESLSFTKKELDDAEWLHERYSCPCHYGIKYSHDCLLCHAFIARYHGK